MSNKNENYGINTHKSGYYRLNTAYQYACPKIDRNGFQTPSAFLCPDPSVYEKCAPVGTESKRLTSSECENYAFKQTIR